jgi:hypothetical protein
VWPTGEEEWVVLVTVNIHPQSRVLCIINDDQFLRTRVYFLPQDPTHKLVDRNENGCVVARSATQRYRQAEPNCVAGGCGPSTTTIKAAETAGA